MSDSRIGHKRAVSLLPLVARGHIVKQGFLGLVSAVIAGLGEGLQPFKHFLLVSWLGTGITLYCFIQLLLKNLALERVPLLKRPRRSRKKETKLRPRALKLDRLPWPLNFQTDAVIALTGLFAILSLLLIGRCFLPASAAKGPAGEASIVMLLADKLGQLQKSADEANRKLTVIDETLATVKKETSSDPTKELGNKSIAFTEDAFLEKIKLGDLNAIKLFLEGGMKPQLARSQGRNLAVMLSLNEFNPGEVLALMVAHGLSVDHIFTNRVYSGPKFTTFLSSAIEQENQALLEALLQHKAALDQPIETYGFMGMGYRTFPVPAAISLRHYPTAERLLDAGASPAVGDYSAYRETRRALRKYNNPEWVAALRKIADKSKPTALDWERVDTELRIEEVDFELVEVAKKEMQAFSDVTARNRYSQQYDELQVQKAALVKKLNEINGK